VRFEVIVAGSGEEEEALRQKAKELDITEQIRFEGWIGGEKKGELLKQCQALVLPSYNEGLPMAVLEALSYGMPVVATNVGDIPSAVCHGSNGYLFEPGDVAGLAQWMERVLLKDTYESLSDNAKKTAAGSYAEDTYFSTIGGLYKSVAGEYA
jgi:glycosyltransferase involved in cell wall biosynthesis